MEIRVRLRNILRFTNLFFFLLLASSCTISRPTVTQLIPAPPLFMVSHPLSYSTDDKMQMITVPKGFITDLASIPSFLWWWESPHESTMAPAIIHDFLYWEQSCTKDEADAVMYLAMLEVGLSRHKTKLIYIGVRTDAAIVAWDNNTVARRFGESRFLTERYANIIMDSQIEPNATLTSIQLRAAEQHGIYKPALPNAKVKRACEAALKKYETL